MTPAMPSDTNPKHWRTYRRQIVLTLDTVEHRLPAVATAVYRERLPLAMHIGPGEASIEALDQVQVRQPIQSGKVWGGQNEWRWFKTQVAIPADWTGQSVGLYFALGHPSWRAQPEVLAYMDGSTGEFKRD